MMTLRRGPTLPSVRLIEDVGVGPAFQGGLGLLVLLKVVQILQEQQPGGLFGVVEFCGATGLFPEDVIDIPECLLEHISSNSLRLSGSN